MSIKGTGHLVFVILLTLLIWEIPKQVLLQTAKTQMKCCIIWHFIRVYTVFLR